MDLSKLRIPAGTVRVEIDDPADRCLVKPVVSIAGWFATVDHDLPEDCQFRIGGIVLPHQMMKRPDVEGAMPDYIISGFLIKFDLFPCLPYLDDNRLTIRLVLPEFYTFPLRFTVKESALASCISAAGSL